MPLPLLEGDDSERYRISKRLSFSGAKGQAALGIGDVRLSQLTDTPDESLASDASSRIQIDPISARSGKLMILAAPFLVRRSLIILIPIPLNPKASIVVFPKASDDIRPNES